MFSAVSGGGVIAQRSEHWCALSEALGSIPSGAAWIFFQSSVPLSPLLSFNKCVEKNGLMFASNLRHLLGFKVKVPVSRTHRALHQSCMRLVDTQLECTLEFSALAVFLRICFISLDSYLYRLSELTAA